MGITTEGDELGPDYDFASDTEPRFFTAEADTSGDELVLVIPGAGQSGDTARALLQAAEDLDLDVAVVRTSDNGFLVPAEVADKAKLPDDVQQIDGEPDLNAANSQSDSGLTEGDNTGNGPRSDNGLTRPDRREPAKKAPAKKAAAKAPAKKAAASKS